MSVCAFDFGVVNAEIIKNEKKFDIKEKSIIINISDEKTTIHGVTLDRLQSSIFNNITLYDVKAIVCIPVMETIDKHMIFNEWTLAYNTFNTENLKNVSLYHSTSYSAEGLNIYLWYASPNTNCQIHREHNFKEIHTQIYGLGSMQLFEKNDVNTLYCEIMMSVGYSHSPIYDEKTIYPWHQYYSYTDTIWMVFEEK